MQCHECGRAIQAGDRFCTGCGVSLSAVNASTEAVPAVEGPGADSRPIDDPVATERLPATELLQRTEDGSVDGVGDRDDGWGDDDPVWAVTGPIPATAPPTITTGELPHTEPITEVWMDRLEPQPDPDPWAEVPTGAVPATAPMPVAATPGAPTPHRRFRITAVTMLGVVGGIALLVGLFATIVEITSSASLSIGDDAPVAFRLGTWIADDLGDNVAGAGLVASLAMVLGGVAAAFGWRWGSGLAGGGGLAAAGVAALVIGLAQYPIDAAHEFADIPTDQQFTLTITRALGYWLLVAAGAVGIVVFFASTNHAWRDRHGGLNPWIAALGALAVVIAAAGPLLPEDLGVFSDNWYVVDRPGEPPAMLVAMRLVQLGLLAIGGMVGFLSVRRWGLGVAAGATLPSIWLGVSTLFELGSSPIGPGFRNPGAADTSLHGVTIIGLSATLAMLVLAAVAAYDQSTRR